MGQVLLDKEQSSLLPCCTYRNKLNRQHLLLRLELEIELQRGLRLLLLCASLFAIVIFSTIHEMQNPTRLGLRKMYAKMLQFDDVADIKTRDDFLEYMLVVLRQSRMLQPVSSLYFIGETWLCLAPLLLQEASAMQDMT